MRRSPFSIFRENNKVLMVLLTGLAMFAFIVMDAFSGPGGGGGTRMLLPYLLSMAAFGLIFWLIGSPQGRGGVFAIAGVVVGLVFAMLMPMIFGRNYMVSSTVGNLTEGELQERIAERQLANRFLVALAHETMPNVQPQQLQQITFGPYGGLSPAEERQEAARLFVMAQEADELGIRVSNHAVSEDLKAVFGKENLTSQAFIAARREVGVSEEDLYDILRYHLKARQFQVLSEPRRYVTPAEQWDAYRKMTVSQMLSVAEVPVAAFAGAVQEPGDAELTAFFEQYKNDYPQYGLHPDRGAVRPVEVVDPAPEFGVPRKIALTYLKADFEKFRVEPEEPTEEQIRAAYFDLLAEEYDQQDASPNAEDAPPAYAEPDAERFDAAHFEAARDRLDLSKARLRNAQQAAFETQKRVDAAITEAFELMDSLAAEHRRSIEQGLGPNTEKSAAALKEFAAEHGLEYKALPLLSALELSETQPVTEEAVARYYRENREQFPRSTFGRPAVAEPSGERGGEDPEAWKYRPLDEVRAEIRERLSSRPRHPIALAVTPDVPEEPTPAQFYPDVMELRITRDPKDPVVVSRMFSERPELLFVPYQAIESEVQSNPQSARMFGVATMDRTAVSNGDRYVYWKRTDVAQHVPTLKEVREEVVRAWRIKEARPKAKERAEELAKLVRDALKESKETGTATAGGAGADVMTDVLEGQTVTEEPSGPPVTVAETGEVHWMEIPPLPMEHVQQIMQSLQFAQMMQQPISPVQIVQQYLPPPTIPTLPQVPKAGEEFMETAFRELEVGEVGVAPNADRSAYFVVRVDMRFHGDAGDVAGLREEFLNFQPRSFPQMALSAAKEHLDFDARSDVASRWRQQFADRYELDVRIPVGAE